MNELLQFPIHPYKSINLSTAGYVLGFALIIVHLVALLAPAPCKAFLVKAPRNEALGQFTLAVALLWFFLLIAPAGDSIFSSLRMDISGFERIRPLLQVGTLAAFFLMIFKVKEFLFVRAVGVLGLLLVAPLLCAAQMKEPTTRLLIPLWSYAVIGFSLFWLGKPYCMRDQIAWVTAKPGRWLALAWGGLLYGVAIVVCDYLFW